jgi:hypothetical protein
VVEGELDHEAIQISIPSPSVLVVLDVHSTSVLDYPIQEDIAAVDFQSREILLFDQTPSDSKEASRDLN